MQVFRAAALARTFGIAVAILWATVGGRGRRRARPDRSPASSPTNRKAALPGATVTIKDVDTGQSRVARDRPAGAVSRRRARARQVRRDRGAVRASARPQYQDVVALGRAGGGAQRPDADRRHHGAGRRQRRRDAGRDAAVVGHGARRSEPDSRAAAQRPRLQPADAAAARRHRRRPARRRQVDRGMGTQVSIAGARPNQISYQLDGTDANTQGNGSPGSAAGGMLGVDTVREFQVLVNNYSAEYGRSTGGIVTAVTRSGTNRLHGIGVRVQSQQPLGLARPTSTTRPATSRSSTRNQFGGHARRADRPRPHVLLRQLRRPAPGRGA